MIWAILSRNPLFRAVAWALGGILALAGFGALQRHRGASDARAKAREDSLRDNIKTRERIDHALEGIGAATADDLRQRMHDRDARKP